MTTGVHWLRATTFDRPPEDVAGAIAGLWGDSVEVREGGKHFYDTTHAIGPVLLWSHSERPEQGVCVEVTGAACDELGPAGLVELWSVADWRASRVDLAIDGCPFTPADVRDAWRADDVRTRVKVAKDARDDRQWRACEWSEHPTGDLFGMGRRVSGQYMRVYDRRETGTRSELELKGDTAAAAAPLVVEALAAGGVQFSELVVGLVRRFVDFVDSTADTNRSRAPLLDWWASFVDRVAVAGLTLGQRVIRTATEVRAWAERSIAPMFAVLERVYGADALLALVESGRDRWGRRHRDTLRLAGYGAAA